MPRPASGEGIGCRGDDYRFPCDLIGLNAERVPRRMNYCYPIHFFDGFLAFCAGEVIDARVLSIRLTKLDSVFRVPLSPYPELRMILKRFAVWSRKSVVCNCLSPFREYDRMRVCISACKSPFFVALSWNGFVLRFRSSAFLRKSARLHDFTTFESVGKNRSNRF